MYIYCNKITKCMLNSVVYLIAFFQLWKTSTFDRQNANAT